MGSRKAPRPPTEAHERIFTAKRLRTSCFAPLFLERVPHPLLRRTIADLVAKNGHFCGVHHDRGRWWVRFEQADIPVKLTLNEMGQIASLLFQTSRPYAGSLAEAV